MKKMIFAVAFICSSAHAAPKVQGLAMVFPGADWYEVQTTWTQDRPNTHAVCTSATGRTCTLPSAGKYKWFHQGESRSVTVEGDHNYSGSSAPSVPGKTIISDRVSCQRNRVLGSPVDLFGFEIAACTISCPAGELLTSVSCNALRYDINDTFNSTPITQAPTLEFNDRSNLAVCSLRVQTTNPPPGERAVFASGACVSFP